MGCTVPVLGRGLERFFFCLSERHGAGRSTSGSKEPDPSPSWSRARHGTPRGGEGVTPALGVTKVPAGSPRQPHACTEATAPRRAARIGHRTLGTAAGALNGHIVTLPRPCQRGSPQSSPHLLEPLGPPPALPGRGKFLCEPGTSKTLGGRADSLVCQHRCAPPALLGSAPDPVPKASRDTPHSPAFCWGVGRHSGGPTPHPPKKK